MCRDVAGSACRWGARRGACPTGRRLTVPFRNPQGACLLGYPPPLTLVLILPPSPPAPQPPSPPGKGETISLFCRGRSPRHPGIRPFTALTATATMVPGGGLALLVAGSPCHYGTRRGACPLCRLPILPLAYLSAPIPPTPFPAGRGRFLVFLCKGLRPLHPRGWTRAASAALPAVGKFTNCPDFCHVPVIYL